MHSTDHWDASFSDPSSDGDMLHVSVDISTGASEYVAIAALMRRACREHGLPIGRVLARAVKEYSRIFDVPPGKKAGGRPSRDWQSDYGKDAWQIELGAVVRRAASTRGGAVRPSLSMAAARRASLAAARVVTHRSKLPDATLMDDAAKLKQAIRLR